MDNSHSSGNTCGDLPNANLQPTPVNKALALKSDGFTSLLDALDYAARGDSGGNKAPAKPKKPKKPDPGGW